MAPGEPPAGSRAVRVVHGVTAGRAATTSTTASTRGGSHDGRWPGVLGG
jgi:hypothetical protein